MIKLIPAKITAILVASTLFGCASQSSENCKLDARYTFNFEQAQYYAMPEIDFSFNLSYDWQVRMPEFGKQNFNYYEAARYTDDSTGSVLLKIHPFKRKGAYISVKEQRQAQEFINVQLAKRDSWKTQLEAEVEGWAVNYGIYEQEPRPYIIAHKLILNDIPFQKKTSGASMRSSARLKFICNKCFTRPTLLAATLCVF
jgi:hypothetical protein